MALVGDAGGGGRRGPYWRRKLGITLPGEYTQEQLNQVNFLRRKAGLAEVGGPVGFNTRTAVKLGSMPGPAFGGGPVRLDNPGDFDPLEQPKQIPEHGQGWRDMVFPDPEKRAMPQEHDLEALRQRLLQSVQQPAVPGGRDALRNFVQQARMRRPVRRAGRPILPPRQGVRTAVARHPY